MGEPANLPSFSKLSSLIAQGTGEVRDANEPEDRFLGRLQHQGVDVDTRAIQHLSRPGVSPTNLHRDILRLYTNPSEIRIVTTNFDTLFETAAQDVFDTSPQVFQAPALPQASRFSGIVHVHGSINQPGEMVLTDAGFGRAYLTEGWARRFLLELFRNFTVLFVGYSYDDVVMNYLTRALPVTDQGLRFILTDGNNPQQWQLLGIEPIEFPMLSEHNYSALYEGIRRLGDFVRRNVLDWQREITEIASNPPPLAGEESDKIVHALKEVPTTRFFANAAKSVEWITWLDKQNYLDALFQLDGSLSERDQTLVQWLTNEFAFNHPESLFRFISQHGMRMHPEFWFLLGRELGLSENELDDDVLSRWVSLLIATSSTGLNCDVLFWLGERCARQDLVENLLQIFDVLSSEKLTLQQCYHLPGDSEERTDLRVRAELQLIGEHYEFNELWEKHLRPILDQVAESLFRQVTNHLENLHYTLYAWQQASREWDSLSYGRSAIEPHEQDKYPESVDVLIDVARDCLEWLMQNKALIAIEWCDQFADSEVPLLRRLAVYTYFSFSGLTADNKTDWLLSHGGLHDNMAHHEIYHGIGNVYSETTQETKEKVIAQIHSFRWPDESDEQFDRFTARQHFDWLSWIHNKDPQCLLVKQALDKVLERYPEFEESEHPDLTHWTGGGTVVPQSPWKVEELLSKPAGEWLPELLSFQGNDWRGPDRNGLIQFVQEAAKQQFAWGIALAEVLKENGNWESDLWRSLLRAWKDIEVDEHDYLKMLGWLELKELQQKYSRKIADILYNLVRSGGKEHAFSTIDRANEIACQLLASIDRNESQGADDWLREAINHPAGILAEFWLESISIWRKQQDPVPSAMNEEYKQALLSIINDHTNVGLLGKSVLASQCSFLLAADEEWTKTNLLPRFSEDQDRNEFHAVWDGFLMSGQLSPPVATLMEKPLFHATQSFDGSLFQRQEDSFVKYYTAMLMYYITDPIDSWIPELFDHGDEKTHRVFASNITVHLRNMDETRQQELWSRWLKRYWENRLQGVPAVLEPGEIKRMLEWLPHLSAVFPDAVTLAIQMPGCILEHCSIIHNLKKSTLPTECPVDVAKLLIYMGVQLDMPSYIWHGAKEIIMLLLKSGLPADIEQRLRELMARLGLQ